MPSLQCTVNDCAHFNEQRCSLNKINVKGDNATCQTETCCGSFYKVGAMLSNLIPHGMPEAATDVDCQATNCTHNRGSICKAQAITIDQHGTSDKGCSECATYQAQ